MVEEKEDGGAGPEQFVVQINVEPIAHKSSFSVFDHEKSKQSNLWIPPLELPWDLNMTATVPQAMREAR